jgi:hypothetical protein
VRKIEIKCSIEGGQVRKNRPLLEAALRQHEGREVSITIERWRKKRSNEQNAYWWGVIVPIFQDCFREAGMARNKEQTHQLITDLIIQKYGDSVILQESVLEGEVFQEKRGTSDLSTSEFMELVNEAQMFASEVFDIAIPDPNQVESIE